MACMKPTVAPLGAAAGGAVCATAGLATSAQNRAADRRLIVGPLSSLFFGSQANQIGAQEDIEVAVRALTNLADALLAVEQQLLLRDDTFAVQHQADQVHLRHGPDEEVALPLGKLIARIE